MTFPLLNEWCSWACILVESGTFTSRLLIPCIIPYRTDLLTSCSAAISEPSPADATEGKGSGRTGELFFLRTPSRHFNIHTPQSSRVTAHHAGTHSSPTLLRRHVYNEAKRYSHCDLLPIFPISAAALEQFLVWCRQVPLSKYCLYLQTLFLDRYSLLNVLRKYKIRIAARCFMKK